MRLLQLSADEKKFRTIRFRPGLNVIIGDAASTPGLSEGDSNGVGKTLALRLVHHCLGANAMPSLARAAPDWTFRLDFELASGKHQIARTGVGAGVWLNGAAIKLTKLREWLDENAGFNLGDEPSLITFRSLVSRFARRDIKDSLVPTATSDEEDFEALVRNLFLLGESTGLAREKALNKQAIRDANLALKVHKASPTRGRFAPLAVSPQIRVRSLQSDVIPALEKQLASFQVSENYRAIESKANEITAAVREIDLKLQLIELQIESIREAKARPVDIGRAELLDLYDGLTHIFKPEVLKHFEDMDRFNSELSSNRALRYSIEEQSLEGEKMVLAASARELSVKRDRLLGLLHGKKALDEYASVALQLAEQKSELFQLESELEFAGKVKERIERLKSEQIRGNQLAMQHADAKPLSWADEEFRNVVLLLYPKATAGISFDANVGDNKVRYDLATGIDTQESDGVGNAAILCYDWTVLTRGHHDFGFLWHDNRLFADLHAKPRAAWFTHVVRRVQETGKQYIASLNKENFDAMTPYLDEDVLNALNAATVTVLSGERDEDRLMGMRFG